MGLISGGLSVDDRGKVSFVNDFDFKDVKRFYMVENHSKGFVRAWHGHKDESKYVLVVSGSALVAIKPLESTNEEISTFVLSESTPKVLYIPAGNYNGFKTLEEGTKVIFFSTATIEESMNDDVREPARRWDIWSEDWR